MPRGRPFHLLLCFRLAVQAAVGALFPVGQGKDLGQLLLHGGNAAGVFAADHVGDALRQLKLPSYVKTEALKKHGIPYEQTTDLEAVMPELDILYMTRVQRERFFNEEDYLRLKDSYILTPEKLKTAKPDLCILHPLPRVNEISVAVDGDPRACYFKQVRNGRYIRMALILKLLGIE